MSRPENVYIVLGPDIIHNDGDCNFIHDVFDSREAARIFIRRFAEAKGYSIQDFWISKKPLKSLSEVQDIYDENRDN